MTSQVRPKILWISHFPPFPPKGGASQRSYNMLKELSSYADITLIALAGRSRLLANYADEGLALAEMTRALGALCAQVILVPHGRLGRQSNRLLMALKSLALNQAYDVAWLRSSKFAEELKAVLAGTSFDVIHVDTIGMWQYVQRENGYVVLNHHNIESHMMSRRAAKRHLIARFYLEHQAEKLRRLEQKACTAVDMNVTCSEMDSQRLRRHADANCHVIPNGVDTDYFTRSRPYTPSSDPRLIFVGGLDWYPNREAVDYLIADIWPAVIKLIPQSRLTIVGRGRSPLLEKAASMSTDISLAGFVADVRPYLEDASVFVCPIMDGGGTKLKVLDAFSMGVPVVATPASIEGIDAVRGKHYLSAETADQFAECILSLATRPDLATRLSACARELIDSKYAYRIISKDLKKIYCQSVGHSSHHA